MSTPSSQELTAAVSSIKNLRSWTVELYEDTGKYENIAFEALNSTVQTPGWTNFIINSVLDIATGIIDATAVIYGQPLVVVGMTFLSSEIKLWALGGSNRPSTLPDVFVNYALSHLKMQEAMEARLAHYVDPADNYANLRAAWDKTFTQQDKTYKVSDLAKPEHAFPGLGDHWTNTKAIAATEFQKRLWNLIIMKTCRYYRNYSDYYVTNAPSESGNNDAELNDYVRREIYNRYPGVYVRKSLVEKNRPGNGYELTYWNLGINGNAFPNAVCLILFRDDTPGHIINPDALFPRDYVFKQFSVSKPDLYQNYGTNYNDLLSADGRMGNRDWNFTGGYFPELIAK